MQMHSSYVVTDPKGQLLSEVGTMLRRGAPKLDDELELDTLGDRKTALFLVMSDTDTTFNFVIAMLQSQLFNLLCDKADDVYDGRPPVHVRYLLDKFVRPTCGK